MRPRHRELVAMLPPLVEAPAVITARVRVIDLAPYGASVGPISSVGGKSFLFLPLAKPLLVEPLLGG